MGWYDDEDDAGRIRDLWADVSAEIDRHRGRTASVLARVDALIAEADVIRAARSPMDQQRADSILAEWLAERRALEAGGAARIAVARFVAMDPALARPSLPGRPGGHP